MKRILFFLSFSFILLGSCKGLKPTNTYGVKKMSAEKIIAQHYNHSFNFETLNIKSKIKYSDAEQSYSPSATLRIKKDSIIWVSVKMLGITWVKATITPSKVRYYSKIDKTYFEGDFQLLSKWLGTDLDYNKIQQMLLGQAIFNLRKGKYKASISNIAYRLDPKVQLELFDKMFLLLPKSFKMGMQKIEQPSNQRTLAIYYKSYQKSGNQDFPKEIDIEAIEADKKTKIQVEYKVVDYNAKVSFPFTIPSGYKEVTIQ